MNTAWARGELAGLSFICLCLAAPAWGSTAPDWPAFAVRIVSMHPPGSINDPISRPLALELKTLSSSQVALQHHLLDASPSGPEMLAASAPSGQTLGVLDEAVPADRLQPIALLAQSPLVLAAHPDQPYQGFQDVIRAARKRPGQVLVGSPGPRSSGQLAIEEFNALQGVSLTAIAYKSSGPLIADLVSGRMALGVLPLSAALAHAKAGRIRVIGISSKAPDARLPDARPLSSQGLEGYEIHTWWGAFGAEKISQEMAGQISARLVSLNSNKTFIESMQSKGIDVVAQKGHALAMRVAADTARWAALQNKNTSIQER